MPSADIPAKLFHLATGFNARDEDLLIAAQRVRTLERAQHVANGIRRKDDTLPRRIFETSVPIGPYKGQTLGKAAFDAMIDEYYSLSGWDQDGVPKCETFEKLRLGGECKVFRKRLNRNAQAHG